MQKSRKRFYTTHCLAATVKITLNNFTQGPKIKAKPLVAAFFFFCLYALAGSSIAQETKPLTQGSDSIRAVALTFDDGPHKWHTPDLLETLREWNIKASFFVVGRCVAENPLLLQKIHKEGHCIANHSWSHPDMTSLSREEQSEEIKFCNQVVEALTGQRPRFFRPPGGRWNPDVVETAADQDLLAVLWTVNGYDVPPKEPGQLAELILRRVTPGAIVLLHDGGAVTLETLPIIIERLLSEGYIFVTLDQMFPPRITPVPFVRAGASVP